MKIFFLAVTGHKVSFRKNYILVIFRIVFKKIDIISDFIISMCPRAIIRQKYPGADRVKLNTGKLLKKLHMVNTHLTISHLGGEKCSTILARPFIVCTVDYETVPSNFFIVFLMKNQIFTLECRTCNAESVLITVRCLNGTLGINI